MIHSTRTPHIADRRSSISSLGILTLLLVLLMSAPAGAQAQQGSLDGAQRRLSTRQPVFIENKGQWDPRVRFLLKSGGLDTWITNDGVVYDVYALSSATASDKEPTRPLSNRNATRDPHETIRRGHVVSVDFVGASFAPRARGEERRAGHHNYFIGNDPAKWATNVALYGRAELEGIYPGIDAVFYLDEGEPRYDLVVSPGADPSQVRMSINGASAVGVTPEGALSIETSMGAIEQRGLFAYQRIAGVRQQVKCQFVVDGNREVRFDVGNYDPKHPLVIDPLVYSTNVGGSNETVAFGITVDGSGNAYLTGYTHAVDIATPGAYQSSHSGSANRDAFVTKLGSDGTIAYATYLGGWDRDEALGIAVDEIGNVYVAGASLSTNFPTYNALQSSKSGSYDAFVTKLDSGGGSVAYSTYLGGDGYDGATAIDIDGSGHAYVTGSTSSSNFPTRNAYQSSNGGGTDAFVTKLGNDGDSLVYSTYLGGNNSQFSGSDGGTGIAVDENGCAYVTGTTLSPDFPTANAFQSSFAGVQDAFVAKFDTDGSTLIYSTYLGGSDAEFAHGIAVNESGNAFVTGDTRSTDFPTLAACQPSNAGTYDAYVTKLGGGGDSLVYSTYLGGTTDDLGVGIAVDESDNVFVTGLTESTDFPLAEADQVIHGRPFVTRIDSGSAVIGYSSFFGTSDGYGSSAIAIDQSGNGYFVAGPVARKITFSGSLISGRLFHDQNGNCLQDIGEPGLAGRIIEVTPGPRYTTTDTLGDYRLRVVPGTYSITSAPILYWNPTCPEDLPISVAFSDVGQTSSGNDIAIAPEAGIYDLRVSLVGNRIRPGFTTDYYLEYSNVGTAATSGVLHFTYDNDILTLVATNTPFDDSTSNTLVWNLPRLEAGESGTIQVTMQASTTAPVGTEVCAIADLDLAITSPADEAPHDNLEKVCVAVTASFDPNDKAVSPPGDNCGRLAADDTVLSYQVRFQNTGTDTAFTVIIRDELDASKLDVATLTMGAASHPYTWAIEGNNVLIIRFDDILLPDSTADEPNSHGIVTYSLNLRDDLDPGTAIPNRAAIYFDFNAPVITNEVVSRTPDLIITGHPDDEDVVVGELATFSAAASDATSVQWQYSTDGGANWSDIPDATSSDYSFTASLEQSGYLYRATFASDLYGCRSLTHSATLTVKATAYEFGPAVVFLGPSRNSDNGREIDLKVELYKNETLVSSGELSEQTISGASQNSSRKYTIPLELTDGAVSFGTSDYLHLKVYARRNGGTSDFSAKAWYNDSPSPSINQGNKGWSRVGFTTDDNSTGYFYLRGDAVLSATSGSSGESIERTLGTSWELFDTWTIAGSLLKPGESTATVAGSLDVRLSPNPFSSRTTIRYRLPQPAEVRISMTNMLGEPVAKLVDGTFAAGEQVAAWNGCDATGHAVESGIYFYRIEANGKVETGSIVVAR